MSSRMHGTTIPLLLQDMNYVGIFLGEVHASVILICDDTVPEHIELHLWPL